MTRAVPILALVVVPLLAAGCSAPAAQPTLEATAGGASPIAMPLENGAGLRVRQAVDIVLVGFDPGMGEALQARLDPIELKQLGMSSPYSWPGIDDLPTYIPSPLVTELEYEVTQLDAAAAAAFFASLEATEEDGKLFDGNDAETKLLALLAREGIGLRPGHPILVILHAGDHLATGHGYRYAYPQGRLDGVRIFGEREGLLVADVSAAPDRVLSSRRAAGTAPPNDGGYTEPIPPGGEHAVEALRRLVDDATRLRLVKGAGYPVSVAPCHHVTLVLAVHTSSLTHQLTRPAQDWVDAPGLERAFENLTGEDVLVDARVLLLPQDDPVLDAMMRNPQITMPMMRDHLDKNFGSYVDLAPGCEEYLAINLFGDATTTSPLVLGIGGIAMYDISHGRRLAFGWLPEHARVLNGCTGMAIIDDRARLREACNHVNFVYAHEVGHLFGMWHTQTLPPEEGDTVEEDMIPSSLVEFGVDFESVWSTMGYRPAQRMHDFSRLDHENWARARAAQAVHATQRLGLDDTPAFAEAMAHFASYAWSEGFHRLAPDLAEARAHTETERAVQTRAGMWIEDLSWLFETRADGTRPAHRDHAGHRH